MANEKFWFLFPDKPNTKRYIDEPINFGDADFQLNRKENGMGMDATISGGELKFRFTIYRTHYLEDILYLFHKDGFEADLKFGFSDESGNEFLGEVDFVTADTNDFDYFECSVILESEMQIFKRRSKTKVDLFSNTTIDGEVITPLVPIPMLLQAKPVQQVSQWKQASQSVIVYSVPFTMFNITQSIVSYGINNTLVPFPQSLGTFGDDNLSGGDQFQILEAQDNLNDVKLFLLNIDIIATGGGNKRARIILIKGSEYPDDALSKSIILLDKSSGSDLFINEDIFFNIQNIQRGEKLWLFLYMTKDDFENKSFIINSIDTKITVDSTAYNSTPLTFRLIDVMRQVAKSTSNLAIYAPRYENAGQFYDTVLTNGKLLGGNVNDPFYISWEDIEKSINPEHNADNEIQLDKRVFVGIEADYYTNEECWFFDNTQFSGLKKKPNPMYCINEFKFKYEKYQSLKEATEPNSGSTIHGESILTPFNKKVENSKECSVSWNRDAILLDVQQRLSTRISEDTATQDDDTIFAIDTIETANDQVFTETTELNHTWTDPFLSLRSNGDINFLVLGIKEGTAFIIQPADANSANYVVHSVSGAELLLTRINGNVPSTSTNGIRLTRYTYEIKKESIPLTNRTNEGFTVVLNLTTPTRYSNLRYSVERNIRNYWNSFLATVNLYHKNKPLRNTFYKNNGKCETEYAGLRVTEKEDFIPTDPIVTPMMYENVVFANVDNADFVALQNALRTRRGFIRTIDNNNRVIKLYPDKISYQNKSKELTIGQAKEKSEKAYLTIVKQNGIITVNNETKLRKLIYKVEEGNKIVLFDLERQRLYNGIYWDKVMINNYIPQTLTELISLLDLLA